MSGSNCASVVWSGATMFIIQRYRISWYTVRIWHEASFPCRSENNGSQVYTSFFLIMEDYFFPIFNSVMNTWHWKYIPLFLDVWGASSSIVLERNIKGYGTYTFSTIKIVIPFVVIITITIIFLFTKIIPITFPSLRWHIEAFL